MFQYNDTTVSLGDIGIVSSGIRVSQFGLLGSADQGGDSYA